MTNDETGGRYWVSMIIEVVGLLGFIVSFTIIVEEKKFLTHNIVILKLKLIWLLFKMKRSSSEPAQQHFDGLSVTTRACQLEHVENFTKAE
jgi:hypothetical protein